MFQVLGATLWNNQKELQRSPSKISISEKEWWFTYRERLWLVIFEVLPGQKFLEKMLRAGLLNNSSGSFTLEEMVLGRVYPFSFDGMSRYVFVGTPAACIYYFYYYLRIIYSTEPKNWKMNPSKSASSLLQSLEKCRNSNTKKLFSLKNTSNNGGRFQKPSTTQWIDPPLQGSKT